MNTRIVAIMAGAIAIKMVYHGFFEKNGINQFLLAIFDGFKKKKTTLIYKFN
jgi:hypothetical protein